MCISWCINQMILLQIGTLFKNISCIFIGVCIYFKLYNTKSSSLSLT